MLPLLLDSGSNRIIHEVSDLTHNSCKVRETVDLMADICRTHLSGSKTQHQSEYSCREEVNNSGWAAPALQAVLRAFHTTDSFEDALIGRGQPRRRCRYHWSSLRTYRRSILRIYNNSGTVACRRQIPEKTKQTDR